MLLLHRIRAAASRTFCTAGKRSPIRIAMIAITTSSSISVKPFRVALMKRIMDAPLSGRVPLTLCHFLQRPQVPEFDRVIAAARDESQAVEKRHRADEA